MSADGEKAEGNKHKRLFADGNETPLTFSGDESTAAPFDDANDDWGDDLVAGGVGVSARKHGNRWVEGVERD